jgi:hypothetical protein
LVINVSYIYNTKRMYFYLFKPKKKATD